MVESDAPRPEPLPSTSKTAGEMLASAREAWQLSVEDVASNLNLGADAIDALERDQYDRLPGCTFVKGYLRSYASLLRLDPDQVIARVDLKPERFSGMPSSKGALKPRSKALGRSNMGRSNMGRSNRSRSNKPRGLFFKSVLLIVVLAGMSLFGLNQLSHLDTEKLARFLKLPIAGDLDKTGNDSNGILFPATEDSDSPEGQKEALIRVD